MDNMKKIGCYLRLGDMVEGLISIITLGNGYQLAYWIAQKLGYESCGCAERKDFLNGLSCREVREMTKKSKLQEKLYKEKVEEMKKRDPFTYKHQ